MIHAYSLIHDDLPAMDDDDLRRGLPTCHKKFGEALAILAGDALLTLAFQVLAEGYPPATAAACCRELARAAGAAGMVGGQVDDLAWERAGVTADAARCAHGEPDAGDAGTLHARKTGALIRACLRLGALAAHAPRPAAGRDCWNGSTATAGVWAWPSRSPTTCSTWKATPTSAGKRVGKDAARGKLTYPGLLGVGESRRRAERLCREAREQLGPLGAGRRRPAGPGLVRPGTRSVTGRARRSPGRFH